MGQQLNPDQIKELASDPKFTQEDLKLLTPQEQAIYQSLHKEPSTWDKLFGNAAIPLTQTLQANAGPLLAGAGAAAIPLAPESLSVPPAIAGAAKTAAHYGKIGVGTLAGYKAAELLGLPAPLRDMMLMMGGLKMAGGKMFGGAAAAEGEVGALEAERAALRKKLSSENYPPEMIEQIINNDRGKMGMAAGPTVRPGVTLEKPTSDFEDVYANTKKGVTNDFTPGKMVTFDKSKVKQRTYEDINLRDAYPPNVTTQSNSGDLMEMLTGSSHGRGESPTPMQFNDKDLRNTLDRLKNATARRRP